MKALYCFYILIATLLLAGQPAQAGAYASAFAKNLDGWQAGGEGEWSHNSGLGHGAPGCIEFVCGKGQQMTMYRRLDLAPGRHRVTAWLRAFDVAKGEWNQSIMIFHNAGTQEAFVVRNLQGTFDWSRVDFTMEVTATNRPTTVWFRLKSSGTLWLDDISVEPFEGEPMAYTFTAAENPFPSPNPPGQGIRCPSCYRWMPDDRDRCSLCGTPLAHIAGPSAADQTQPDTRILLGFEAEDEAVEGNRHYFTDYSDQATQGARSALMKPGSYYNTRFKDPGMSDWSGYDYLALDVYNPQPDLERFAIALNDKPASGYWDQLNHLTSLMPGWNHLRFHVNRYVGERGSVRIKRYLNLANIQRFWISVAPENPGGLTNAFLVDNIRLIKAPPPPAIPEGAQLFDFVAEDFRAQRGFLPILDRHRYHPDVGFGFLNANLWRSHDSIYADDLNRDGIFIRSGKFVVDVPNGRYTVALGARHLGYWSEHFWTRRKIEIEGQVVVDETRTNTAQRLAFDLQFEDVEPEPGDHPYDLYLRGLFAPVRTVVEVTDGQLDLSFAASDCGVCLNWLIVAPAEQDSAVTRFLTELDPLLKSEFDDTARLVTRPARVDAEAISSAQSEAGLYTALVGASVQARPGDILRSSGAAIAFEGGVGQRPLQALLVRNLGAGTQPLRLTVSALTSADGRSLAPAADWVRRAVNQYQCHSYNHETYELAPRYLRPMEDSYALPAARTLLTWLQIPVTPDMAPGLYTGTLSVALGEAQEQYPVALTVHPYTLPGLDIPAGHFGLDPVNLQYETPADGPAARIAYRHRVLDMLAERGFTAWSSLPPAALEKVGEEWVVVAPEIDDLMAKAKALGFRHMIMTYGGGLMDILRLDQTGDIAGLSQEEYRRVSAAALQKKCAEWLPLSVTCSDEAAGYSSMVGRDLKRLAILKTHYPFLGRSGASAPHESSAEAQELNFAFTEVLLSSQTRAYADLLKEKGVEWGMYNQSTGLFQYDRPSFGLGVYVMKRHGMKHFYNFGLTLFQNLPYYDLDGREYDSAVIYPRQDGSVLAGLKFEWAALGIEDCRLLMLLEQLVDAAGPEADAARQWLDATARQVDPYAAGLHPRGYLAGLTFNTTEADMELFRAELQRHVAELTAAK